MRAHCVRIDSVARRGVPVRLVAELPGNRSQHLISTMSAIAYVIAAIKYEYYEHEYILASRDEGVYRSATCTTDLHFSEHEFIWPTPRAAKLRSHTIGLSWKWSGWTQFCSRCLLDAQKGTATQGTHFDIDAVVGIP